METTLTNGHGAHHENGFVSRRFASVPSALDIPVGHGDEAEAVEVDLEELQSDPTELCMLLENEDVANTYWTTIALAYAKSGDLDTAIEVVQKGIQSVGRKSANDRLPLYNCLCWMYLIKARGAPRTSIDTTRLDPDLKNKDHYLTLATGALNEASRISPSHAPLHLPRGVVQLLRAALTSDVVGKSDALRQAIRSFDECLRQSRGQNMMALLGRARASYSLGKYADALRSYQSCLEKAPDLLEPDPRIGIGCCFWMLGHKDDAQLAWQRSLDLNPGSKIANSLLGIYNLHLSSQLPTTDPKFAVLYKKAMVQHIQGVFKEDNRLPIACATFGSFFLMKRAMPQVDKLATKAVELTDVSTIASDGWYLKARKEHYENDVAKAADWYNRADQARGGDDAGYLPAKFGSAQLRVMQGDPDGAKFRLDKILQKSKNIETMTLLGALWAEDAFTGRAGTSKEDILAAQKRAIPLLEQVRNSWKDAKRNTQPDTAVLLTLARLYEVEYPDKALQCLEQVEKIELDELPEDLVPDGEEDEAARLALLREHLPPQLLNNIACFHYNADRLGQARAMFQSALNACVKLGEREEETDTDALVTSISFNLARTYEADDLLDEARKIYEGLLARHGEYLDARMRLTYITLKQSPTEEGPSAIAQLYESESTDLEVRSLYGWYLRKAKKKATGTNEDQEQRHYKHTLQGHDKHDRYSLTAMGNMYLSIAREMKRDTEADKERRRKMYERAVEFFDKALQLDPRNAYAAQGIGIAIIEDKKDFMGGLQVFSKVRETVRDSSVHVNLGHAYCEVKQYSRGIEAYEAALAKDRGRDPQILACLGRAWLMKGRQDKTAQAMRTSLDYSQRALQAAPDQIHLKFNVAFVQIQIAQLLHNLPESQRTVEELEAAATGLDEAIDSLSAIAKSPNPPFPRHDIEQRANMGRNTMKRQLERSLQSQKEFEERNASRLQQAREAREAEIAKRDEEKRLLQEAEAEQRRKVIEERKALEERDRERAEERAANREAQDSEDEEKRVKRREKKEKRRRKNADGDGGEADESEDGSVGEGGRSKKKRKIERKKENKFKSDEFVVESDEELEEPELRDESEEEVLNGDGDDGVGSEREDTPMGDGDEQGDAAAAAAAPRRKLQRIIDEDEDEDEDGAAVKAVNGDAAMSEGED